MCFSLRFDLARQLALLYQHHRCDLTLLHQQLSISGRR
jgi:hypothetical protein